MYIFIYQIVSKFDFITENGRHQWTVQAIKLLIEEVRQHISILNKKNVLHKKIWKEIARNFNQRGYNVTDDQCSIKLEKFETKI